MSVRRQQIQETNTYSILLFRKTKISKKRLQNDHVLSKLIIAPKQA